jgi:HK97 family phage prohead protease|tara:strand:+ start:464 stop:1630 length:1167 start_codon:yes stop_codon:yes gene_type:complete
MPLVKPKDKETREDFMSRCMSDDKTTSEFPTTEQRLAVCNSQYKNKTKEKYSMNDIEKMGEAIKSLTDVISSKAKKPDMQKVSRAEDQFDNQDDARDKAKEIGCVGTHSMDKDGKTIYMPCNTHESYEEAISKGYDDEEEEDKYSSSYTKPKKKKPMKSVCVCQDDGICQCDTELKKLVFESEIKAESNQGIFTGYGSIFGNEDQGNDIMQKGAFTKSLVNRPVSKVKMLYQHKTDEPIGVFTDMYEDSKGLFVKGQLAMGTQKGREAYELLKMGALDGMSIGFRADPEKQGYNENKRGVRTLKEVDLMEISLVTFPMNESALIETVKGNAKNIREWEKILREAGNLSRTEAKIGAKALSESLSQRDAGDDNKQLADLINKVANIIKQ